jgi:Flp pilus assembly protein TadG
LFFAEGRLVNVGAAVQLPSQQRANLADLNAEPCPFSSTPRFAGNTMKRSTSKSWKTRRGIIAVLSAVLFIVMLAMVAFAVDIGYMGMIKTQLQAAADSAALAAAGSSNLSVTGMTQVAQAFAQYHQAAGRTVQLNTADVQFGIWNTTSKTFAPVLAGQMGTAVKVTVSVDAAHGGNAGLFFGRVLGANSFAGTASAVAMVNPRDICFVVDLSSSMRNDSTPPGNSDGRNDALIQAFFDDLYGAGNVTYSRTQPETGRSIPSGGTSAAMDTIKNYFPHMPPTIQATTPYPADALAYWGSYISYLNGGKISYTSYAQFLVANGRDQPVVPAQPEVPAQPAVWNSRHTRIITPAQPAIPAQPAQYSIMSINNAAYVYHSETVTSVGADGSNISRSFTNFPTREMPTHAMRRAIIAALEIIEDRNKSISDPNQKDQVSMVTFDRAGNEQTYSLTPDYNSLMQAAVQLQACGGPGVCTDSQEGLRYAQDILNGTNARENANKVIIFLTDGVPNIYDASDQGDIDAAKLAHPAGWGTDYSQNAALWRALTMQGDNWSTYSVGVGLGGSQTFMDRMARMAGTAITNPDGTTGAYPIADDCGVYEETVKGIFNQIISNPKLRLVQ